MRSVVTLLTGIALVGLPGCASGRSQTGPLNACALLTAAQIGAAFPRGVADPPVARNADTVSASCEVTVHTQTGTVHLVLATAVSGNAAYAHVCSPARNPDVEVLAGIRDRACWNPDNASVSAVRRNTFYEAAVLEAEFPNQEQQALVTLVSEIVGQR